MPAVGGVLVDVVAAAAGDAGVGLAAVAPVGEGSPAGLDRDVGPALAAAPVVHVDVAGFGRGVGAAHRDALVGDLALELVPEVVTVGLGMQE